MAKYYYSEMNDLMCYPLQTHIEYMKESDIDEMKVFEAKSSRAPLAIPLHKRAVDLFS